MGVVTARVYAGDQALGLTVRTGHTVVVLGYLGEPFVRIDAAGVCGKTSMGIRIAPNMTVSATAITIKKLRMLVPIRDR